MNKESLPENNSFKAEIEIEPDENGIKVMYVIADGVFKDIPAAEEAYETLIKEKNKELTKLVALLIGAGGMQVYQISELLASRSIGNILIVSAIFWIMFYVRNKSMLPIREEKRVITEKLRLLLEYEQRLTVNQSML